MYIIYTEFSTRVGEKLLERGHGMKNVKLLLAGCVLASATGAFASSKCATSTSITLQDRYVIQEIGVVADPNPVLQTSTTLACKNGWSFNFWTSTALDARGKYGNRGYGDEIDFTVGYEKELGNLVLEASLAYFVIADFARAQDDLVQAYVQIARPVTLGMIRVVPFLRITQWVGMGELKNETFVRAGANFQVELSPKWTLSGTGSLVHQFEGRTGGLGAVSLSREVGSGVSLSLTGKFTSDVSPVAAIGITKNF